MLLEMVLMTYYTCELKLTIVKLTKVKVKLTIVNINIAIEMLCCRIKYLIVRTSQIHWINYLKLNFVSSSLQTPASYKIIGSI